MKAKKSRKALIIFLLLVLVSVSIFFIYKNSIEAVDLEDMDSIEIVIPERSSTTKIAEILEENDLIKNKLIFRFRVKSRELGSSLKAGNYSFYRSMTLDQIIDTLIKGGRSENTVRFTIPEGYEIMQMAEKLAAEDLIEKDRFLDLAGNKANFENKYSFLKEIPEGHSLEGFLYPSTYEVFLGAKEEDIIEKMLDEFEKIYKSDIISKIDHTGLDLNELVTLASIVEREGKIDEERPIMSKVFYNRLEQGMMLQSCATVQYILGERKEVLTNKDTRTESPYNTYLHQGLPPAPIASPGIISIQASLNPADVDYLYFVKTGSDGSHTFSNTYKDHLQAKPKN